MDSKSEEVELDLGKLSSTLTFGGWKVGNVYRHLEGVNKRPMGLTSSQRVQNTLCHPTQPGHTANSISISPRAGSSNKGGAQVTFGEGSSNPSVRQPRRFLFKPLPGTQEEWSNKASNQPDTVEQVSTEHFKMERISTLKDIL